MRIIALQGRHNSGKTTTLKQLIKIINKNEFICQDVSPKGDVLELCNKPKGDIQCWFTPNGVKVGITTRGDAKRYLHADFFTKRKNFRDRDIVVCAIRSKGGTVEFVREHGTEGILIRQKSLAPDMADKSLRDRINLYQANELFDELKFMIREIEGKR